MKSLTAAKSLNIALCRGNKAILQQKLELLTNLNQAFGDSVSANTAFSSTCPIVGSSIGQHYRHILDHVEQPVKALLCGKESNEKMMLHNLHYDVRNRGGSSETDVNETQARIQYLMDVFAEEEDRLQDDTQEPLTGGSTTVHFMLSDDGKEFPLVSSLSRELQFVLHHAIHHLAMVKIIAVHHIGLQSELIPRDFGKAPSTLNYEK